MKTVILAAGKGTRMKTLTAATPKPMLNVGGKPILEHILIKLKEIGLKEFVIIVGYLSDKIKDYFKDGKEWDIKINYIEQREQNGTGAAVLLAKEYVEKKEFILTNGDIWITKNDFR
ncbi:MAG TPA: sugar phosphate nucleotidyltransferase, partial [bacterium]|nr:sugar phosphate nucleotidyltransferase [bacterium]